MIYKVKIPFTNQFLFLKKLKNFETQQYDEEGGGMIFFPLFHRV
jgi:hypothetical protein